MQGNYIVAAPDFDRIASSGFKKWFGVELPEVPPRWKRGDIVDAAQTGIEAGVWQAEHHGYTHVSQAVLFRLLGLGDSKIMKLFQNECLPLNHPEVFPEYAKGAVAASFIRGIDVFRTAFGYLTRSTCAPNYVVSRNLGALLAATPISILQGANRVYFSDSLLRKVARFSPQIARSIGLKAFKCDLLKRSVDFEPRGEDPRGMDDPHWRRAFRQVESAMGSKGVAIISTHRLNFVHHDNSWVKASLSQLRQLLNAIKQHYPRAVYVSDWEYIQLAKWGVSSTPRKGKFALRNFTGRDQKVILQADSGAVLGIGEPNGRGPKSTDAQVHMTIPPGTTLVDFTSTEQTQSL